MGTVLVLAALGLAGFCVWRSVKANRRQQQSNALLSDFMAAEMAIKASQLEGYKQMLRNPNPRPQPKTQAPRSGGIDWEEINNDRRRF